MYQDFPPGQQQFQVCHDVGCENLTEVVLSERQWENLRRHFNRKAISAHQERLRIATAIAEFERLVGPIANTMYDEAENNGSFSGKGNQLDCIAEAVNSTTYLTLFQQRDWLHWHRVALPRHRGWASLLGPHNTAVIQEIATGNEFVVDSWFEANGLLPHVVPLETWLAGYFPAGKK